MIVIGRGWCVPTSHTLTLRFVYISRIYKRTNRRGAADGRLEAMCAPRVLVQKDGGRGPLEVSMPMCVLFGYGMRQVCARVKCR